VRWRSDSPAARLVGGTVRELRELDDLGFPEELDRVEGQPKNCVHPYVWQWSGRCEGCRETPLSKGLPNHYARRIREEHDDAA
jgi:hypothetical protein